MAYRLYPVTKTETFCDDYKIKVNGEWAMPDSARVSAVPFNRRWPGHQREKDQTETVNFLSLAIDSPVTFEIYPKEKFESVKIRPASAKIKYEITEKGSITFISTALAALPSSRTAGIARSIYSPIR